MSMAKRWICLVAVALSAVSSFGGLLSQWYADHHDNPLEWVIVGQEAVETKNISGVYRFQTADAELVNTAYGWELVLGHNEIYGCGIKAEGDLIIRLKAGMRTLITPVEDGGLSSFSPTGYKASTSDRVFGIKSDSLLIYGPGELVVMHMAVDANSYDTGRGINCWGNELKISNGAMLRVESAQEDAIDGVSAQLSIVNAVLETRGCVFTRGKIQIDHSIVNIMSQGDALESWEKISIKDSCCSFIAKKGVALGVRGLLETDESIIYAYSQNNHCVVSSYDASSKSGYGCVFGKGFYRFATNGGEDYAAIDSDANYDGIIINGAHIETCAPGGIGVSKPLGRITMNSGRLRHRSSMDFKKDFFIGRELLDAYGLLMSWNSVGIELGYSPEKIIGVFLGETLINWLQKQSIDNPKGNSIYSINGLIDLNGGTIISDGTDYGIYKFTTGTHVIKGGSLQGPILPAPVDANGNELACVTNVISNGTAYEQVTSGWTAKLPEDYNTSSLFVDSEKKLYFWVPPDIGFYKPDEWSSPFFVTSDPDGTKPMSRVNLGEPVYLKYGFKNLAGHAGMKGFFNSFTLNGKTSFTNRWEYSTLKAGEWGWGGAYWCPTELQNLPNGTYTLKCELDVTDKFKEANEGDNVRTITFTVGDAAPITHTIAFDANNGIVSPTSRLVADGATLGELPVPTRNGYVFDGWYTSEVGGTKVTSSTIVTSNMTLYAHWTKVDNPEPTPEPEPMPTPTPTPNPEPEPTPTPTPEPDPEPEPTPTPNPEPTPELDLRIKWTIDNGVLTEVELNGATVAVIPDEVKNIGFSAFYNCEALEKVIIPNGVTNIGYCAFHSCPFSSITIPESVTVIEGSAFRDCRSLTSVVIPDNVMNIGDYAFEYCYSLRTVYIPKRLKDRLNLVKIFSLCPADIKIIYYEGSSPEQDLNPEIMEGLTPSLSGGEKLYEKVEGVPPEDAASVYDGYLYNGNEVAGTIQAKVAKPKNDIAKVTAAIQITGEKKVSVKGELDVYNEVLEAYAKDGRELKLNFGYDGMKGTFGAYEIDGARNFFSSKDKDEKTGAENVLAPWLGALNMKCPEGVLSVTIAKKGKVTVKGTYNGAKVSAKAQALIGEDMICIPVMYSKKSVNLAFTVWLPIGGNKAEIIGLKNAVIGKAGTLVSGAEFNIVGDITDSIPNAIEEINGYEVLPYGESVSVSGKKWVVAGGAKAAKIAYKKGELTITEGKKGQGIANPSGLKLTYKSKDGSFTGSFTVYAIEKGKLKKHKATVTGVLINGIGYGTATIKKIGDWAIEIK